MKRFLNFSIFFCWWRVFFCEKENWLVHKLFNRNALFCLTWPLLSGCGEHFKSPMLSWLVKLKLATSWCPVTKIFIYPSVLEMMISLCHPWGVVAERSSLPDSSSGVSSRMWVRIPAVTLVSLSKTLNHNCFSPPRG